VKLTEEQQTALVADYRAHMPRVALVEKYHLHPPQLYAYLRRHKVRLRMRKRKPRFFCAVCGKPRPLPVYSPNSIWLSMPTCGRPECKSVMLFRPDLHLREVPKVIKSPRHHHYPKGRQPRWNDLVDMSTAEDVNRLTEAELAAIEKAFRLGTDERLADLPETARKAIFGRLSEVTVAIRLLAEKPAETTLEFDSETAQGDFFRMYFGDEAKSAREVVGNAYDILLLWRCGCPEQTVYLIRNPAEFPCKPGEYGVCERCGAAAMELT